MNIAQKQGIILGLESSCDDTSAAVLRSNKILSNIIADQKVHQAYGGVVPELASRAHQQNIVPVVDRALQVAGVDRSEIDAVAFTQGPGLLGSLLVGSSFAKTFALGLGIPLIGVHHMKAHVHAHFIQGAEEGPPPSFPFLCLTVSGGHTQIVKVNTPLDMEVLGQTLDDAAGEAFDKAAKILGLSYPGGPLIDQYAQSGRVDFMHLPEPKIKGLNYSFSGLKTAILYHIQAETNKDPEYINNHLSDLCATIQYKIITILLQKLRRAARETGIQSIALAGGVSANSELRSRLRTMGEKEGWETFIPPFEFCTDNAAMIAMSGYFHYQEEDFSTQGIVAKARLPF